MRATFAFLIIFCSFSAFAQSGPGAPPVITRVDGQVVTAVFADGREAEWKVSRVSPFLVPVPYKVSENGCKPGVTGMEFNSTIGFRLDRVGWIWTKHSDPAKIDKILMARFGQQTFPLFSFAFVTNTLLLKYPDLAGTGLAKDEFSFSDLTWLPGMESGLSDFTVEAWNAESMVPNSQTELNENRITGGATNVVMKKTGDKTMTMQGADSVFALPIAGYALALIGDVVTWKWLNNGEACQISFKPNLGPANVIVTEKLSSLNDPFTSYLWNSDSLPKVLSRNTGLNDEELLSYAE